MENSIAQNFDVTEISAERESLVLVIDDNADLLDLNRTILELNGFKVLTAQSGTEALAILSNISFPDLILLDMRMDDMSGSEFLTTLELTRPDIIERVPVVFLTGMDKVPPSKAVGFIKKPMNNNKFLQAIRRFIEMGVGTPRFNH